MADEAKIEVPAAEAPIEKSDRQIIEDSLSFDESTDEAPVAPDEEATEESSEAEPIATEEKVGTEEEPAKEDDTSEIDKIIKEAEGDKDADVTPNVQKRFDKLTAEKRALEERLARLESQQAPQESGKLPKYSDEQLQVALKKGMEEGDTNLVWQVMDHVRKQTKQDLIEMYEGEKNAHIQREQKIAGEWQETVDAYKQYADTKVPEIWPNSHKDLDIRNGTGLLYQIAMKLYYNSEKNYKNQPSGQKLAVADAFTYLMRTKAGKQTNTRVKSLTKQLTKERMKKSPVSGGPSGGEKSQSKPLSADDTLAEVIAERRKYQEEREH